jgi:enoyl-CoA hydratase
VTEPVGYTLEDKVAIVTMDDGKANALSKQMLDGVVGAMTRAEAEASAVVLAGRPERFCAGFDLRVMMSSPAAAMELLGAGSQMLLKLYGLSIPLVIACSGHAIAGGALTVLTGDYRIGAAGAFKIGLNEVAIGMPVPLLAMEFARSRLSPTELHHATLSAKIYTPDTAVAAGYLDEVVPADQLLARARAEAARMGGYSRSAFRATKTRLRGKTIEYITANMEADVKALLSPS